MFSDTVAVPYRPGYSSSCNAVHLEESEDCQSSSRHCSLLSLWCLPLPVAVHADASEAVSGVCVLNFKEKRDRAY